MSFVKLNLVLKTDGPTDRPTDRQTDGPTNLSIEATCRRLKIDQSESVNTQINGETDEETLTSITESRVHPIKSKQTNELTQTNKQTNK